MYQSKKYWSFLKVIYLHYVDKNVWVFKNMTGTRRSAKTWIPHSCLTAQKGPLGATLSESGPGDLVNIMAPPCAVRPVRYSLSSRFFMFLSFLLSHRSFLTLKHLFFTMFSPSISSSSSLSSLDMNSGLRISSIFSMLLSSRVLFMRSKAVILLSSFWKIIKNKLVYLLCGFFPGHAESVLQ